MDKLLEISLDTRLAAVIARCYGRVSSTHCELCEQRTFNLQTFATRAIGVLGSSMSASPLLSVKRT